MGFFQRLEICQKENTQPDYCNVSLSIFELFLFVSISVMTSIFLAWFFYKSLIALLVTSVGGMMVFVSLCKNSQKKRSRRLLLQFKECILSVAVALRCGMSLENAFIETSREMRDMYGDSAEITLELAGIKKGLQMNVNVEFLLADFAMRSGIDEMREFSEVINAGKRSGADIAELIDDASSVISDRIDCLEEANTLLAGRRMEILIMRVIPFFMVAYIELTTPGFFESLYGNAKGVAVMTGCLFLYILSYFISGGILNGIEKQVR